MVTHRTAAAACALAIAYLLPAGTAWSAISYIGGEGTGAGQFTEPSSLAVNAAGELVVADTGNGRIQRLSPDGDHLLSFGSGFAPFSGSPRRRIAIGTGDTIFQTGDSATIHRFTKDGASLGQWDWPNGIRELTSDGDGNLYVASFEHPQDKVVKFSPDGVPLSEWPVLDGLGDPRQVSAMEARGNALTVVTRYTQTLPAEVIRYSTTGTVLSRWELLPGSFWSVTGVTIADGGDLFVVGGQFVVQFSESGAVRSAYYGGPVDENPDYSKGPNSCEPTRADPYTPVRRDETVSYLGLVDVAVDAPGNIYALDPTYARIVKFDGRPTASLIWGPRRHWSGNLPVTAQTITFDAGGSELPFGSLEKFEWDLDGDGTFELDTGTNPRAARTYATAGARQIRVRVTGSSGLSSVAEETLEIAESQAVLVASRSVLPGDEVWFSAVSTELPCGIVLKYEWDLDGDGRYERDTGTTPNATATYREVGGYEVGLRVTRAGGRVDEAKRWLEVRPSPPPGEVGVSINKGAEFTNSDRVTLQEIWPKYASKVIVSNEPDFSPRRTFPVRTAQPWVLDSSGSEQLPKMIYVRFAGATYLKNGPIFTDEIVLDEIDPIVRRVKRRSAGRLLVKARDTLSGLAGMQVTRRRGRPGKWLPMRRISPVPANAAVLWVRVRDKAGNRSGWKLAR